jgi:hypothetical protein
MAYHRIAPPGEHVEQSFAGVAMSESRACRGYLTYMRFHTFDVRKGEISCRIASICARMNGMLSYVLHQKPLLSRIAERLDKVIE